MTITEDNSSNLDKLLLAGQLDLVFYNLVRETDGLTYEHMADERIMAILRKDHPLHKRAVSGPSGFPGIRLSWLTDETFIVQNRQQRLGQYIRT